YLHLTAVRRGKTRGLLDGGADARVRGTAAEIAVHRLVDVLVGRLRISREQRGGRHDLARLAVPALHDVQIEPGGLDFLAELGGANALDGGDGSGANRRDGCYTGADRRAVDVDRAGPALGHSASVLGAFQIELITQHPQEGCIAIYVDGACLTIHLDRVGHRCILVVAAVARPRLADRVGHGARASYDHRTVDRSGPQCTSWPPLRKACRGRSEREVTGCVSARVVVMSA